MKYIEVIKKGWDITWSNKVLWFFGFFAGVGFSAFRQIVPSSSLRGLLVSNFLQQLHDHQALLIIRFIVVLAVFIAVVVAMAVLHILASAALVALFSKIEKKEKVRIKEGFVLARKYFWRLLLIEVLLFSVLSLAAVVIILISFLLSPSFGSNISPLYVSIVGSLLAFIGMFVGHFSIRFAVLYNLSAWKSFLAAFALLAKKVWPTFVMVILVAVMSLAYFICSLAVGVVVSLPILLLGVILYILLHTAGLVAAVVIAIMALVLYLAIISGLYSSFVWNVWTLTFMEFVQAEKTTEEKTAKAFASEPVSAI